MMQVKKSINSAFCDVFCGVSLILALSPACALAGQDGAQAVSQQASTVAAPGNVDKPLALSPVKKEKDAIQDLIDSSRMVSPELHAHALLLLVESGRISEEAQKLKLAREAFETAREVQEPVKKTFGADASSSFASDAGASVFAFMINQDRLSLESRAIADVTGFNPAAARRMAQDWRLPEMAPVSCTAALASDLSAYYKTLTLLAHDKKANLKAGKDTTEDLLYPAVSNLQTHTQVPLVLALLQDAGLTKEQQQSLTQAFLVSLSKLNGDERGFAWEMLEKVSPSYLSFTTGLSKLDQNMENQELGSGQVMLRTFRQYLVENAQAGGCGVSWMRPLDGQKKRILPKGLRSFNEKMQSALKGADLEPISLQEADSQVPAMEPEVHPWGQDDKAKQLFQEGWELRSSGTGTRLALDDLSSSAWRAKAIEYLGKIDDWQADPSNSLEVFEQKLVFYASVIDLAPREEIRWLAIEKALILLENSGRETESPAMWMWDVLQLRQRVGSQVNGDKSETRPTHDFTQRLMNSKSRSLRLLGLLEAEHLHPFQSDLTRK